MRLPAKAVHTLSRDNVLVIRNPDGDCYRVRNFYLELKIQDGRSCTSCVDTGPYSSDRSWKYAQGRGVPRGEKLPRIHLYIPLESGSSSPGR